MRLPVLLLIAFLMNFFSGCLITDRNQNVETVQVAPVKTTAKPKSPQPGVLYKVIGVKDGDTFEVLVNDSDYVIRLEHIDSPERNQPFGSRAKQLASDLCFGKMVYLIHHNQYDRNKRLIAEVVLENGTNVNREMVREGMAWHFKRYSKDTAYAALEMAARERGAGIWSDSTSIAPADWRSRRRAGDTARNKQVQ